MNTPQMSDERPLSSTPCADSGFSRSALPVTFGFPRMVSGLPFCVRADLSTRSILCGCLMCWLAPSALLLTRRSSAQISLICQPRSELVGSGPGSRAAASWLMTLTVI